MSPGHQMQERGARAVLIDSLPGLMILAAILAAALKANDGVLRGEMVDPDSYMVLVRLKAVLAQGGWNGGFFPRDNAPFGMVLHWTKSYDLIFLALAAPFALFASWDTAIAIVAPAIGPLCIVSLILLTIWASAPVAGTAERRFIGMVLALAPLLINYGMAGNATHHIAIVAGWAAFMGYALRVAALRRGTRDGAAAGITAALALWLSVECILPVALGIALMGLAWIRDGEPLRRPNLVFAAVFLAAIWVLLAFDPPYDGFLHPRPDRLSIVYAVFAALLALLWVTISFARQMPEAWRGRLIVAVAGSAVSAAVLWLLFPHLFDPKQATFGELGGEFWSNVEEMAPAFAELHLGVMHMGAPAIGLLSAIGFVWVRRGRERVHWTLLALMLLALIVPGVLHVRFAIYPQVLAALPTACFLAQLGPIMDRIAPERLRLIGRSFTIALVAVSPLLTTVLVSKAMGVPKSVAMEDCAVRPAAPALNDPAFMGGRDLIIMTHPNQAPDTLYWTGHRVVAGLYHLNVEGLSDAMGFVTAKDDAKARAILTRRGVGFVMVCGAKPQADDGKKPDEAQLFARLRKGSGPDWLKAQPWPPGIATDLKLFRVRPQQRAISMDRESPIH